MADYFWILVFVSLRMSQCFLFDQMSDGQRCPGSTMLCPPMCRKYDSSGCIKCDCNNINPAMPMNINPANPSINTGSGNYPANPLNGGSVPGSTGCSSNWQNCACTPSIDAASGCIVCSCGPNNPSSSPQPATQAPLLTTNKVMPTNHVTPSSSGLLRSSSQSSSVMKTTIPITSMSYTTSTGQQTVVSSAQPVQSTNTAFNTKLPNIATTPAPSKVTSLPPTSTTQAAFICPGIFNCSLDCYAGFVMDGNGCPKCQCAPIPTDLP